MAKLQRIAPCLWFDSNAEAAVKHYCSIFAPSKVLQVTHDGRGVHMPKGAVLVIAFELLGQEFLALNGGPQFRFTEAVSMVVRCADQAEIDFYWEKLLADGGTPSQCGWLKDRFGLSWQVVPATLTDLLQDREPDRALRVLAAIEGMVKLDLAALQRAYDGR